MDDDDTVDGPRLADLISEPEDVPKIRERVKTLAKQARDRGEDATVDDFLAQSRKNDAAYIAPVDLEKAEWIADIYEREGRPETHPRNFHYQILGKGYEKRNGEPYTASNSSWTDLKEAFKWARIIGLVDSSRIEDAANPEPTTTAFSDVDNPLPRERVDATERAVDGVEVDDGFQHSRIPREIELAKCLFDDFDEFIQTAAKMIADQTFQNLYFDAAAEQPYYIEIWSEKSGVVPESMAREYAATIRESGKGEFSLSMCEGAIEIANARNQKLAVCIVSDFDAAGADMPISAARKLEVLGAIHDVEVELVHGAVTKQQVEDYGLPGDPGKIPDGLEDGVRGAKGYETQKEVFREYAGQYPVEIQGFSTRHEDAFGDELAATIDPYYDAELDDRLTHNLTDAREQARRVLVSAFESHRGEIEAALVDLRESIGDYHDDLESNVEAALQGLTMLREQEQQLRDHHQLVDRREDLSDSVSAVDYRRVVSEIDVDVPDPLVDGVEDALLDTQRSLIEQLDHYRAFNVRYVDE